MQMQDNLTCVVVRSLSQYPRHSLHTREPSLLNPSLPPSSLPTLLSLPPLLAHSLAPSLARSLTRPFALPYSRALLLPHTRLQGSAATLHCHVTRGFLAKATVALFVYVFLLPSLLGLLVTRH